MATQFNGSSYYRANPYYQQGYLPDTAFKNRKPPSYMVELPQGDHHFQQSNKKHFQRLGYYSTIGNQHIMDPDPVASPSREKMYFRNLVVDDIQGTGTNTLISKAVKNKMKAKEYLAQRDRMERQLQVREKIQYIQRVEDDKKRMEALSKINKSKEPNYHQKMLKLKTQQSQRGSPPPQSHHIPPQQQKKRQQQYEHRRRQLQRTERQIRQLQAQLRGDMPQHMQKRPMQNYRRTMPVETEHIEYQTGETHNNRKPLYQAYQEQEPSRSRQQYSHGNKIEKLQNMQRFEGRQQGFDPKNLGQTRPEKAQPGYPQHHRNFSDHLEPLNKIRSLTTHQQQQGKLSFHPESHESGQRAANREVQTPIYDQRNSVRQTRQQHRKFNPTYLSYGSASIGLAGRNVVGY